MKSFEEYLAIEQYESECRARAAIKRRGDRQLARERRAYARRAKCVAIAAIATVATVFYIGAHNIPQAIPEQVVTPPVVDGPPATEYSVLPEEMPIYTAEELDTLALVIYQEAGGDECSDETRLMVGTVVLNRVADDRYPDTITEVATQYKQYGRLCWTGLVWPERAELPQEAYAVKRAYDCATQLLDGDRVLPSDVIYQAEFIQGTEVVAEADGFYFCR